MLGRVSSVLCAPFRKYNELLERFPLATKCVTSGVMYGGGDVLAQYTETYVQNRSLPLDAQRATKIDGKRVLVFFVFGSTIAGVAFNYWFNYLNELPALLWNMKNTRHRGKILRSYAYLKAHGIEVKLDLAKLPHAAPLTRWKTKAAKILADQLIFSSTYTLVFFMAVGVMSGGIEKWELERSERESERALATARAVDTKRTEKAVEELDDVIERLQQIVHDKTRGLQRERESEKEKETESDAERERDRELQSEEEQVVLLQKILRHLHAQTDAPSAASTETAVASQRAHTLTWKEIFSRTWAHCREVYWKTYLTDCVFWPPLQLINFTFVPVQLQFLYVNVASLAWNTFLSLMANKKQEDEKPVLVVREIESERKSESESESENEKKAK